MIVKQYIQIQHQPPHYPPHAYSHQKRKDTKDVLLEITCYD
jgi:hypothetical protein